MALTKNTIEDKVEIMDCGDWSTVQVRTATVISDDGVEVSRTFSRKVINPTDDFSKESAKVKAVCDIAHTSEAQKAFAAYEKSMTESGADDE